jgi:sugar phosphate isomerase/epimerase
MIKSAVTISLVPEAGGGPFVFWDLEEGCQKAAELGFDGVELFAPDAKSIAGPQLGGALNRLGLHLAAAGTGAGWVKHKLTLTSPDASVRRAAREFVRSIIDAAGARGAPAIIGSMQGRWGGDVSKETAGKYLAEALEELGEHARQYKVHLLFEPLNRYETNIANTLGDAHTLLNSLSSSNVRVLADVFHMNIEEETPPAEAITRCDAHIGHVHMADSNRRPAGYGHVDWAQVGRALHGIRFDGYVSAECLPYPTPQEAAGATIHHFRRFVAEPPPDPDA